MKSDDEHAARGLPKLTPLFRETVKRRQDIRLKRFATESELAFVYGLEQSDVRHLVKTGQIPGPDPLLRKFDLKAVEAAFDRRSGLAMPSNAYDAWKERRRAS
jgi:hypothetical protein